MKRKENLEIITGETIYSLVKEAEKNYTRGKSVKIGRYVDYDMYDIIENVVAYCNSRHISGKTDALGREKPFFNIVLAAINTWYKATDLDRKHIRIKASNKATYIKAFVASIMLRKWLRNPDIAQALNQWGRTSAKFNSAILKIIEKGKDIFIKPISWLDIICDPVDFENNIKIEKLYFTSAQLRDNETYDQEIVEKIISSKETRKTLSGENKDDRTGYIGIYEVHGKFPLSLLTGKEKDKKIYRQQMHVIYIYENKRKKDENIEETLYSGIEEKDPYVLTHLIPEEGRTLGIGSVEMLFDPQWMANHSMKQVKDQLDLASKMILQTADKNFAGRNVLTNIETGDILTTADNKPITQVNNQSHDVPVILNYLAQWQAIARQQTGTFEAITGETMPSGTPYRQAAMLNAEANSLFDLMRENKGIYLEKILREYIIPHFKKSLNNSDEIALMLEAEEVEQFDELALPANLANEIKFLILNEEELPTIEELTIGIQKRNSKLGKERFLRPQKTWKEYLKDLEWDIEVNITDENIDKKVILETLNTIFMTIAQNPMILQDPNAKMIFNKILEEAGGVSPLQWKQSGGQQGVEALGGSPQGRGLEALIK